MHSESSHGSRESAGHADGTSDYQERTAYESTVVAVGGVKERF